MQKQLRKIKHYLKLLGEQRWQAIVPVEGITVCPAPTYKTGHTPPPESAFVPFTSGDSFGSGWDTHAWFRFTVERADQQDRDPLYLRSHTERSGWDADNPQFLVYVDGVLRQGLDTNHREVLLEGKGPFDVVLYAYTGPKVSSARFFADTRRLVPEVNDLYYDLLYPHQMLDYLDLESDEYAQIVKYLYRAVSMLDLYDITAPEFRASAAEASAYLAAEFYGKYCRPQPNTTVCIGHTHIDCAWKWTLQQTREKVQRSFATVLELMRLYPEYKFMSSQALLYQNLKEEAPELYEQVRARIAEGRWECEGAMWVEADCNLSSGESLVRQVLYGKRFFKEEFGVDNHILWLPDVFGYSAALPQILRKSGVDWFVTSKISWNDTNRMPVDTFRWRGIDGTEINTHFLTAEKIDRGPTVRRTTYVANTTAPMVAGAYKRYGQKDIHNEALLTFGFGDGGGGPTAEMLELARRGAKGIPGSPNVTIEFAGDYLDRLAAGMENNPDVARWQGELYLEFHRGTYTSIARNKRNNRKCELLYQNAELLSIIGEDLLGIPYPADLRFGWENILTNQFHDIIPGSSIKEVYDQCDIDYAMIRGIGEKVVQGIRARIADGIAAERGWVVFNPTSFAGEGLVQLDGRTALVRDVPAMGYCTVTKDCAVTDNHVRIDGRTVETNCLRVAFDEAWQMISIYDKQNDRELLMPGAVGNELRLYADFPDNYDAWEWMEYSRDQYRPITAVSSVEIIEDGARRGICITRPHMQSTIRQTIWFTDDSPLITIDNHIDWHQHQQMLKAAFPVDINADKATYEIQFGTIERPTHSNTSWDRARFEVCAHKYADLSDGGYGVSLLNDCKYGHDIHDGTIQLSLLRSPSYPNPDADQGEHLFTYALYPHAGTFADSDTPRQAYRLNAPLAAVRASGKTDTLLPPAYSAVAINVPNVICETVKAAEAHDGYVMRAYETKNRRTAVEITLGMPVHEVWLCDLLENPIERIPVTDGRFTYRFGGFEIATFKVR